MLKTLSEELKKLGLDNEYFEETNDNPLPRLVVPIGSDHNNNIRILNITGYEQLLPANKPHHFLQMQFCFEFKVKDASIVSTSRFINFINNHNELAGFQFDEIEGHVYFRYFLLDPHQTQTVYAAIGLIEMLLNIFQEQLEAIASGKETMNQFLEKMVTTHE